MLAACRSWLDRLPVNAALQPFTVETNRNNTLPAVRQRLPCVRRSTRCAARQSPARTLRCACVATSPRPPPRAWNVSAATRSSGSIGRPICAAIITVAKGQRDAIYPSEGALDP